MHIYGTPYLDIVAKFALPLTYSSMTPSTPVPLLAGTGEKSEDFLLNPGLKMKRFSACGQDPSRAMADYHCNNLEIHLRMYAIGDKYCIRALKTDARSAFRTLLNECFNSPKMLDIIELVFALTGPSSKGFRAPLIHGISRRADLFNEHRRFRNMVRKYSDLGAELSQTLPLPEFQPAPADRRGVMYCRYHQCRRNVQTKKAKTLGTRVDKCLYCDNHTTVIAAKQTLWPGEPVDDGGNTPQESEDIYDGAETGRFTSNSP